MADCRKKHSKGKSMGKARKLEKFVPLQALNEKLDDSSSTSSRLL